MIYSAKTDKGIVRNNNEDSLYAGDNLLIVADGMGGHNAGEVASSLAIETAVSSLKGATGDYEKRIIIAIKEANSKVHELAKEDKEGMGTTIDICICDNGKIYGGHVGDSRVYVIRDGKIIQLTEDHSFVETLIKKGEITREEAKNYPMKHMITKAIGVGKDIEGDFYEFALNKEDKVLLCTDGLTNMVSDEEIERIVKESININAATERLIEKANKAGGKDNITIILAEKFFD